eukprot:763908_1
MSSPYPKHAGDNNIAAMTSQLAEVGLSQDPVPQQNGVPHNSGDQNSYGHFSPVPPESFDQDQVYNKAYDDHQYPDQQNSDQQQYPDQQYANQQYSDQQYTDQQYTDQQYTDQQYTDQQYTDQQYTDQQYTGQQYTDQQSSIQEHAGQQQVEHQNSNQQYTDQQYSDQQNTDQQYPDQQYPDQQYAEGQYPAQEYGEQSYAEQPQYENQEFSQDQAAAYSNQPGQQGQYADAAYSNNVQYADAQNVQDAQALGQRPMDPSQSRFSDPEVPRFGGPQALARGSAGSTPGDSNRSSPRIDPTQIPRPEKDSVASDVVVPTFYTRADSMPPVSTKQYIVVDEGNCSPRFVRMTTNHVPNDQEIVESTHLLIAAVIQPLANVGLNEEKVSYVDPGPDGPVRCSRCRAYVNPFFKFVDNGKVFICNMCNMQNDVPHHYICNLDANGKRRDCLQRRELCRGSVEFKASKEYILSKAQDPCYLFVLDVSYAALVSGLLQISVNAILSSLDDLAENPRNRVGVVTYDSTVHFYSLKANKDPEMLVVTDLESVFVPAPPSELMLHVADPEGRQALEALLNMLPNIFGSKDEVTSLEEKSCFGSACSAAAEALTGTGGKLILIQSSMPEIGLGALKMREDINAGGEEGHKMLQPQTSFYEILATKCAENRVCVDLFSCTNSYVDIASLGYLARFTCGQLFYYSGFDVRKDGEAFHYDMMHTLTRPTGFDGVMMVRASAGLRVADHMGSFFMRHAHEMELPAIDSDKTFAVRLEHEDILNEKSEACIQVALLYTSAQGERLIRVHTMSVPITSVLSEIYRYADMDAIVNVSLKQVVHQFQSVSFRTARENMVNACIDVLFTYRKYCAHSSSTGQLILPESLKLLPLFTLGLIKGEILSNDVRADERAFLLAYCITMPSYVAIPFVCPHLYSLHNMADEEGTMSSSDRVIIPQCIRLSKKEITANGLYLVDNGRHFYISVGAGLDPQIIQEMFGVPPDGKIEGTQLELMDATDNPADLISRVRLLLDALRFDRPFYAPLVIMEKRLRQNAQQNSLDQNAFLGYLIEDSPVKSGNKDFQKPELLSYVDFLCMIHRRIQDRFIAS